MASPTEAAVVTTKSLTGLDIGIIAVYFVIIFGIGVYFARKGRNSVDYFLAGRNVGWFAIGASLFVSNISTEHFIGLADHIYRFCPVRAGPEDLPRLHGTNERISVANLGELVRFYHQLLRNLNAPQP